MQPHTCGYQIKWSTSEKSWLKRTRLSLAQSHLTIWVMLDNSISQSPPRKRDANHCLRGPRGGSNELCINCVTQQLDHGRPSTNTSSILPTCPPPPALSPISRLYKKSIANPLLPFPRNGIQHGGDVVIKQAFTRTSTMGQTLCYGIYLIITLSNNNIKLLLTLSSMTALSYKMGRY